jgi:hypothetical protein
MAGGLVVALRAMLAALIVLGATVTRTEASTILVREELGFSFVPSQQWVLEEEGASITYDLSSGFGAGAIFDLRYTDDMFLMTAMFDNSAALQSALPFGIDVYPGGVDPVTPDFVCEFLTPCYNGLGFIPWNAFPMLAGQFVSIAVPPGAAVGEPAAWMLLALALGLFAWTRPRPRNLVPSV